MTIASCPRCLEQVLVPGSVTPQATVRCPLCQEEYTLSEALRRLPPALIVVDDLGEGEAYEAPEITLEPLDVDATPTFDWDNRDAAMGSRATARPKRSRRPKSSPFKTVLSIVLGGLLAFPAAQLILWYLPGNLKRDLGFGPTIAQYVPQIVPAKFHGKTSHRPSEAADASNQSDFDFDFTPASPGGSELSEQTASEPSPQTEETASAVEDSSVVEPAGHAVPETEPNKSPHEDSSGQDLPVPKLNIEPPQSIEPKTLPPSAEEADEASQAGTLPEASRAENGELAASFANALAANSSWDADVAKKAPLTPKTKQIFYQSMSRLGEALAMARTKETSTSERGETTSLLREIANQDDKLVLIGHVASGWLELKSGKRPADGVALLGVVTAIEPLGDLFVTRVQLPSPSPRSVAVVSHADPTDITIDEPVLVIGAIIEQPAKHLVGYEGDEKSVVLLGAQISLARQAKASKE